MNLVEREQKKGAFTYYRPSHQEGGDPLDFIVYEANNNGPCNHTQRDP